MSAIRRRLVFLVVLIWMSGWAWSWFVPINFAFTSNKTPPSFGAWWCVLGPAFLVVMAVALFIVAMIISGLCEWALKPTQSERDAAERRELNKRMEAGYRYKRIAALERELGIGQPPTETTTEVTTTHVRRRNR